MADLIFEIFDYFQEVNPELQLHSLDPPRDLQDSAVLLILVIGMTMHFPLSDHESTKSTSVFRAFQMLEEICCTNVGHKDQVGRAKRLVASWLVDMRGEDSPGMHSTQQPLSIIPMGRFSSHIAQFNSSISPGICAAKDLDVGSPR